MYLVIESITNYIFALLLYVTSFTMAFLSIDQYYSLVPVYNNPLDKVSTSLLIKIIWSASSVLSILFLLKGNVIYYEWRTHSLVCFTFVNYLRELNENKIFRILHFVIRFILQYFISAIIIFVLSFGTVVHFLKIYFQKKELGSELMIALRIILIFIIFITSNTIF